MSFKRHLVVAVGLAALLAGMVMSGGPAYATGINGVGTVSCTIAAGTIKFSPALKNTGIATKETVTVKTTLSGCSGTGDGARVTGGTAVGKIIITGPGSNVCTKLVGTQTNKLLAVTAWKVTGLPTLNKSTVTYTSETGNVGPPVSFDTSGSATHGSFNGDPASAHAVIKETAAQIATSCGSSIGLVLLHIISSGSTASLT
jgi:hypothetical protein